MSTVDFLNNGVKNGGLRPNRFKVTFTFPAGIGDARQLTFLTKATSLPGGNIGTATLPYMGREVKLPGDVTFNDWTATVICDAREQRDIFYRWQNKIQGNTSNSTSFGSVQDQLGTAEIQLIGRDNKPTGAVTKVKMIFPTTVGELSLGWDQNNAVLECPISFAVNDVEEDGVTR
jgi:hypothetical protein